MLIWNRFFDREGINQVLEITDGFEEKRIIIKNNQEIIQWIEEYLLAIQAGNDIA